MTSRRQFFRLMAAAPIAVPVIAKEMAEAVALSESEFAFGTMTDFIVSCDFDTIHTGNVERLITFGLPRQRFYGEIDVSRDHDFNIAATPNRLYGAQINADGEAV